MVTGAAMGIGRAIAERLVAEGIHVVAVDRNESALAATCSALGTRCEPLIGDIGEWAAHERAADAAERLGNLRYWVNNAGLDWSGSAHEIDAEHIDAGLRVLLSGPLYGMAVAVRRMLPSRSGSIVNVASIQGIVAFPRYPVYAAAKAGVVMASKSVAVDYAAFGIRCNAVLPGTIDTPMTSSTLPGGITRDEALRREGELAPMLRVGQPEEIADAVWFLLSERASYITGAEVVVDGGSVARCYPYEQLDISD